MIVTAVWSAAAAVVALAAVWWLQQPLEDPLSGREKRGKQTLPAVVAKLAATRTETAEVKLDQGRPGEALAILVTALREDPSAENARIVAERILRDTVWHFPDFRIRHPLPVERLAFHKPSSLWVGLSGKTSTVVRWDLDKPVLESVLFPVENTVPRSMVIDPAARRMVVERAGVLLLCDAQSLKPLGDLGELPQSLTPESVIVFSADGLLMAHPLPPEDGRDGLVWLVRDARSGQVLRRHEPQPDEESGDAGRALSAWLDRHSLSVLHADGSVMVIPVSPVEEVLARVPPEPVEMPHAQYAADGRAWLALVDHGPHQPRQLTMMPDDADGGVGDLLGEIMERFPWSRQPGVWNGLLRNPKHAPMQVEDHVLRMTGESHAPIHHSSAITAVARHGSWVMLGDGEGTFIRYILLPLPGKVTGGESRDDKPDAASIDAFGHLASALSGVDYDDGESRYLALGPQERLRRIGACDAGALGRLFPGLDFSAVIAEMSALEHREASPGTLKPLVDRLARFHAAPEDAEPAVQALVLALGATWPDVIAECLAGMEDPPPLVRMLAGFRIAWLEGRIADALAIWPEQLPDLERMRLTEDWDGWEHADFSGYLDDFQRLIDEEYAKFMLPDDATEEQRNELFERLIDPETVRALGRPRLARFCLMAAQAFSAHADEMERCLFLATVAYNFGADPAESLRAKAHAHAALGQFEQAHESWIQLITELPVDAHMPPDYAEAAYTAFENANPAQAMEILLAGIRRFPEDPDYALRAGWIALLTGHPDHAYQFLLTGNRAGWPEGKTEHATVLLAIAAAQCGEIFEAEAFYEELTGINPEWADPETIEALQWPEELKSTLRQLTW